MRPRSRASSPVPLVGPACAAAALALAAVPALAAPPAAAVPLRAAEPVSITADITDEVGALGGSEGVVQASLDELSAATPYDLYVVYVADFGGQNPVDWAQATAAQSGLGESDFVLAVATEARRYALVPESTGDLSSGEVQAAATAAEDHLSQDDWAGAAVATADSLRDSATGAGGGGGFGFGGLLLLGLVVIGGFFVLSAFLRRRRDRQSGPPAQQQAVGPVDELAALPTAELDKRSSSALVRIDDALRTSEQELGFAQAQFGPDATREFEQVLATSKQQVTEAFRLRQTLDDDIPDTEPQVRDTATRIIRTVAQVSAALDAQKQAFDELRDVESRAGDAIEAHAREAAALQARVDTARATLQTLQTRYPATALASVVHNPDQARLLLDETGATLAQGRTALEQGDRATAVRYARAAEEALGQARVLLDAVDHAGADLASAGPRLDAAIASITSDIADAQRLGPARPEVAPRVAAAQTAIATAQSARTGAGDPLAALRTITEAEAAIDAALAPLREARERADRARSLLDETLGRLRSALRATSDFVATRRGAVGPEARTRLAEAERWCRQAEDEAGTEPEAALESARKAEQLVADAQYLAQADVEQADAYRYQSTGQRGGGGLNGVGGMVLGGILLDSILRGGGGWGGGGGGGGGGGFDGGGFGDGGFGGGF
ncbi:TPM domain-containing protein [Cellulomonas sp. H30R-01]|uniref:TPM domain-containing protein n=1 Tax=Cellulomonas sp. H30R-01 TaxID=2704467 RepID=UPI00138CDDC8|nr:TPM domain-containing protein [Cellulomonas sp. H30R-01]QHT58089.1 TPM domain-containing protein [Cellulomonas sp. H30R-01]